MGCTHPGMVPCASVEEYDHAHRRDREEGRNVPVTVLQLEEVQVIGRREMDRDGYTAVQLGAGKAKAKNVAKPQRSAFGKASVEPKARVAEFRVAEDALLDVGAHISADHFVPGQLVDIC